MTDFDSGQWIDDWLTANDRKFNQRPDQRFTLPSTMPSESTRATLTALQAVRAQQAYNRAHTLRATLKLVSLVGVSLVGVTAIWFTLSFFAITLGGL